MELEHPALTKLKTVSIASLNGFAASLQNIHQVTSNYPLDDKQSML